ncbi:MAG TPA: DUF2071 domain-containing protein [Bryobacteraceae bacterium]|nr:DUF2071 domain-containing protein [Bryobacteraceae bacterium]
MRQRWRDLTFIHWRCDPAVLRALIPPELEVDTFDGGGWVGLVPFLITGLTIPPLPPVPWLSDFPETNLRTYVFDRAGRRGVWFFSLDAARLAAVIGARASFGLPYFWSRMKVAANAQTAVYSSARMVGPSAGSRIEVALGSSVTSPTELEQFLTARFRLYARRFGKLIVGDVSHEPWPLQQARLVAFGQNMTQAVGLPSPESDPLVHFARKVDVLVARPRTVGG